MPRPMIASKTALLTAAALLLGLAGCGQGADEQAAPPPPEVDVVTVTERPVPNIIELPGRVEAVRVAEVRARVNGIVQRRLYEEGSQVRAGQTLFQIDPSELRAGLSAVQAALQRARATAANAQQDVNRYRGLIEDQAISQQEYDSAVARLRTAQADVAQAQAQVRTAQLSLGYSRVTAPIAGQAGRAQVTEGALVSAAEGTLLTRIEQLNPVYVNFSQSSASLLQVRRDLASGKLTLPPLERIPVQLELEDGTTYGLEGNIDFLDLTISEETGTSALRAEFANPGQLLLPGQFVRARIRAGTRSNGIIVPQRAVQVSAQGASVLVVGDKNLVEARPVTIGNLIDGGWVVKTGLRPGERIIVNGLQKAMPGQPVRIAKPKAGANAKGTPNAKGTGGAAPAPAAKAPAASPAAKGGDSQ